ncbi:hypothetical protein ACOSQ2_028621 [Xanthoceras sorbifolium]
MPTERPKELPPRRTSDYKIELELGAKSPAKAPYRMALVSWESCEGSWTSCWRQAMCNLRRRSMARKNQVADALSRKEVQGYVAALAALQFTFLEHLKQQAEVDLSYTKLRQKVLDGLVRKYWVEDNLLYAKGSILYVSNGRELKSSATRMSPTELCMGFQQRTPLEVAQQKDQGLCPYAIESLAKVARRMKKYADKHRWPLEFNVGDKVLLKLTPKIWKKIIDRRYHKGLIQRYNGLFVVNERIGSVQQKRAPPVIRKEFDKQIEKMLNHRSVGESKSNRKTDYLVQWKGKSGSEATWEQHGPWCLCMAWWGGTKQTQGMLGGITLRQIWDIAKWMLWLRSRQHWRHE